MGRFGMRFIFVITVLAAVACAAFRVHPMLGLFILYAASLIYVMAWYRWSDMAMSICTVLIAMGAFVFLLLTP